VTTYAEFTTSARCQYLLFLLFLFISCIIKPALCEVVIKHFTEIILVSN
jgi:hypothetical protein